MSKVHFNRLVSMFHSAPINDRILKGCQMTVEEGKAEYQLEIIEDYFHSAEAMHGALYFKLLDDAAYFAAASLEQDYFLLTKSYELKLKRPVGLEKLIARGEVLESSGSEIIAKSQIFNEQEKLVAEGVGVFVRSKKLLADQQGYI